VVAAEAARGTRVRLPFPEVVVEVRVHTDTVSWLLTNLSVSRLRSSLAQEASGARVSPSTVQVIQVSVAENHPFSPHLQTKSPPLVVVAVKREQSAPMPLEAAVGALLVPAPTAAEAALAVSSAVVMEAQTQGFRTTL